MCKKKISKYLKPVVVLKKKKKPILKAVFNLLSRQQLLRPVSMATNTRDQDGFYGLDFT